MAAVRTSSLPLPKKKVYFSGKNNYPVSCRHCAEPKCMDACMAAAITFDAARGVVVHDEARCVGCWMCVMSCPYGAVRPGLKEKLPVRCDMCPDEKEPACVRGCPTKAVIWREDMS
jgi:carbon-monoxide dehydrogenase iron sulfur subunit